MFSLAHRSASQYAGVQVDAAVVLVLPGVESHSVPSCEKGCVVAPSVLDVESPQEGVFVSLAAGATTIMPMGDAPWGDRYGKLKDPFGHEWSVATHKEDVTVEQLDKRMREAMAAHCK